MRRTRVKPNTPRPNTPIPTKKRRTADSYSNPMARIGFGQFNLTQMSDYPLTRLTQNFALLNSLYRTEWIARRIIDTLPQDMTKNWYELKSQLQPDQLDLFATMERKTRLKEQINEGLTWGRLFGGAAGVIVIEGQEDMLDQPLNLELIMPGQYKGLIIADRWSGVYPESSIVQDISDPDFGTPEYYNFCMTDTDMANGIRVHHSRVVRFLGRRLPQIERIAESYWGMSEWEHVYNELDKRNSASANIAHLLWQANLKIFKMRDLGQFLTTTDVESQKELYETLTMQNALMNSAGMGVVDRDDDFTTSQYTFSGISDVYELFMLDVSGASEYPVTKLFGRSPAGMNSTGESDLTNYYDHVKQGQENDLRPVIEKLLPVLAMSTWGAIPDDLTFEFNPVRDSSESERADLMLKYTQSICAAFTNNIISQATALKELRQTSSFTGAYTNIDDTEIDQAMKSTIPDGLLEGFPTPPPPADSSVRVKDTVDFPGQKREKNGQFGAGKQSGGNSKRESNAPSATGANKLSRGFTPSAAKLHEKHRKEQYSDLSPKEYEKRGISLVEQPVGGDVDGFMDNDGNIVRYRKSTNEFAKGHPQRGLMTLYKPKGNAENGYRYFLSKKESAKKSIAKGKTR